MDFIRTLSNILVLAAAGLIFVLAWGATVLAVVAAVNRRALPLIEKIFWGALAVVLPLIGAFIYLLSGPLERWLAASRGEAPLSRLTTETQLPGPLPPASTVTIPPEPGAAPGPVGWRLRVTQGPVLGRVFALESLPARVGRGTDVAVSLSGDQRVSRQHAEFYSDGAALRLRDLGSTHGTRVNARPILDETLRPGDKISMGDTIMVIEYR